MNQALTRRAKHSAQTLTAPDLPVWLPDRLSWLNQLIAQALMIPFCVIVVNVFGYRDPQMPLTQRNDVVETLPAYRKNESFRESVQIRTLGGKTEGCNACVS